MTIFVYRRNTTSVSKSSHESLNGTHISTSDLERSDNTISLLQPLHSRAHLVHDTTKLMAKDISFLKLHHTSMQKMQITTTNSRSRDLQNNIAIFYDSWLWYLLWSKLWASCSVWGQENLPIFTEFFPFHTRAFIVSPLGSAYFALSLPGFVMSCSVVALLSWPIAFSIRAAPWLKAILRNKYVCFWGILDKIMKHNLNNWINCFYSFLVEESRLSYLLPAMPCKVVTSLLTVSDRRHLTKIANIWLTICYKSYQEQYRASWKDAFRQFCMSNSIHDVSFGRFV